MRAFLSLGQGEPLPRSGIAREINLLSCASCLSSRTNSRALGDFGGPRLAGYDCHTDRVLCLLVRAPSPCPGAIALDLGGKQGSSTASGFVDGIGYLGYIMAGDSMARILVFTAGKGPSSSWPSWPSSQPAAVLFLLEQEGWDATKVVANAIFADEAAAVVAINAAAAHCRVAHGPARLAAR